MAVMYDDASAAIPEIDPDVRVMVVDGHRVFAEALAQAIDRADQMRCVAIATSADDAARLACECEPDVVVIDAPDGTDGMETTRALCAQHPGVRVLVLTGSPDVSAVRSAADAGAAGLLPKSATLGVVCETIPALTSVCFTVDRHTVGMLCRSTLPELSSAAPTGPLTRRERDILALLAHGVELQRAAARLGITVNTARGYVKNLYRKLGVHNQLQLVAVARERGLLDPAG
jgi:DNA-binding NarL/FixJ family response regulator